MIKIKKYIEEHQERFLDELFELLKIPSISADPANKKDVRSCAETLKSSLLKAGVEKVELIETGGHPIVFGESFVNKNSPTVLIYGHYDVQPPDPIDLWDNPPFEPVIKNEKIYARGACDDKGQLFMHVKAFEILNKSGDLPVNIKFMIEGEEEVGSKNLENFLNDHKNRLEADVILVSDTSMISNDTPSIETGLRGLAYLEVEVIGPNRDLHSGVYGGGVANPINVLCGMIASLQDENGKITIPGFYDDVVELSKEERAQMAKIPFDIEEYKKDLGIRAVKGEDGYTTIERTGIRPTLDVNGIWGGYIGEGAKTVLPAKANAKISMRLVPNQISSDITEKFRNFFERIAPDYVQVKVTPHHGGEPAVTPTDTPAYKAAARAMERAFGKTPIATRGGGSIPIIALFEKILGLKTVLMGFGLDSDAIHSPNEHFGVFNYLKGIETISYFHQEFANKED